MEFKSDYVEFRSYFEKYENEFMDLGVDFIDGKHMVCYLGWCLR